MAQTIYEATSGALIPQAERTVATFTSGLVRVDRKYICSTDAAATHRATLAVGAATPDGDTTPAIDGMSIFPQPQEIARGDGFTEFMVSSYGRTKTGIQSIFLEQRTIQQSNMRFGIWKVTGEIVIPSNEVVRLMDLLIDEVLYVPNNVYLFSYHNHYMLSIEQVDIGTTGAIRVESGGVGEGPIRAIPTEPRVRRKFTAYMTTDGENVSRTATFWIDDPLVEVSSARNFGDWTELSITTTRAAETATIV